jgi:aspartate/methionine/tyrosine aminotransferase
MSIHTQNILNPFQYSISSKPSMIRALFEEGVRLKQKFGDKEVCDFSLGNPTLPPPSAVADALKELAINVIYFFLFLFSYL